MAGHVVAEMPDGLAFAVLRLVNPGRKNAISAGMWGEIAAFAKSIGKKAEVRAVLIRGDGGFFSAGADISDFAATRSGTASANTYDDIVEETCRLVEAIPQPTMALIEGLCLGAGASLAASCDLRVAAEDASFAVPAARLGLGYDIRGIARFNRIFGLAATTQLLLTADRLPAARAYALGAVHHLAPASEIEGVAFAMADRIAGNAPLTLRAAKAALRALALSDPILTTQALELAAAADASADYGEGRAAFAEKRAPRFKGS